MAGDDRRKAIFTHGARAVTVMVGLHQADDGADSDDVASLFATLHGEGWSVDHVTFRMRAADGITFSSASFEMSKPEDHEALSEAIGLL